MKDTESLSTLNRAPIEPLRAHVVNLIRLRPLQAPFPKSVLIPIPVPKSSASRFRNSVEGLNQEIERIIIRDPAEREQLMVRRTGTTWLPWWRSIS